MKNKYYTITTEQEKSIINIHTLPTIYRYQSINPYSVSALLNDELWGSVPSIFNDPYDMIFCYTSSEIKRALLEKLSSRNIEKYKTTLDLPDIESIVNYLISKSLDCYNDNMRQIYCVASFSEIYDSEIMWGHYADCSKGFVVAYDSDELRNIAAINNSVVIDLAKSINPYGIDFSDFQEDNLTTIAPVIYNSQKFNITSEIIDIIDALLNYYDNLFDGKSLNEATQILCKETKEKYYNNQQHHNDVFYSALCNKSTVWKYEKEWRIWSYNLNIYTGQINNPHVLIGNNAKAKAIYLGERISEYNRIAMTEIAKRKNIPIYIMKTVMLKNNCKLVRELIK